MFSSHTFHPPKESLKVAPRSAKGFTLIEILIAIVIIASLAVVLFSMSRKMIASAKSAKCVSNLRQMHVLVNLQVSDKGYYPPMESHTSGDGGLKNNGGFYDRLDNPPPDCVSCPAAKFTGFHPTAKPPRPISAYGGNTGVMPNYQMKEHEPAPPLLRPHQITRPSEIILMGDVAQFSNPANPRAFSFLNRWPSGGPAKGDPKNAEKPVTSAMVADGGFWDPEVAQIPMRHNGKANLVFCDGHIIQISRIGELKEKNFFSNY
jgi:prepilin-type N-terminal cleavage/methylation domain-containing protein/prepilin-type processing-associated H-X9-DG protein